MNTLHSIFDRSTSALPSAHLLVILTALLFGLFGCNIKPDMALCSRYHTNILKHQAGGHPAVLAAAKTAAGKNAIVTHCMRLTKKQVECSLKSATLDAAKACESQRGGSFLDEYF